MSSSTLTTAGMDEQMVLLMEKLNEQGPQIKRLTDKQSAQLDDIESKHQQMENQVTVLLMIHTELWEISLLITFVIIKTAGCTV